MEPKIIFENENFVAVNKPAGLLMHQVSGANRQEETLIGKIIEKYPEIKKVGDPLANSGQVNFRPGIVHRLDKDTSGVVLIARNQKYFEYLKNLFQSRKIKKIYWTLVWGELKPNKGIIDKPISLKPGTTKRTVFGGKMEKEAITEYEVIKVFKKQEIKNKEQVFSLLKVEPKTGRTHQIRIHLSSVYHPVVGDQLYGSKKFLSLSKDFFGLTRQFLHAQSLEFPTEEGKRVKIEADLPEDLQKILDFLSS